jgi:PPM family protein phosphatase
MTMTLLDRASEFCESVRDSKGLSCLVSVAWQTTVGLVRSENQDTLLAGVAPQYEAEHHGVMAAVFDGMGGRPGGALASQMAAEVFADARGAAHGRNLPFDARTWLKQTLLEAHRAVCKRGREEGMRGMGTTATVVCARNGQVTIGHVGDTRAYRLRDGHLTQLTRDHTMVQALIDSGKSRKEAVESGWGGVLCNALGVDGMTEESFDVVETDLIQGDVLLLSSDGMHEFVPDWQIRQILDEHKRPREAARRLVHKAYEGLSSDNVSVIVAKIQRSDEMGGEPDRKEMARQERQGTPRSE